ncbi:MULTISPECIES: hypothetical protein [Halomonas]|uniref:hypothetical protein n=1 Tax=Halomonas TaxID=2745 RepID=UPI003CEE0025
MTQLVILLVCAFIASILHLATPSSALGSAIVATGYVILIFTAFFAMLRSPASLGHVFNLWRHQKKCNAVLSHHWDAECEPHHLDAAYKAAAQDGCLPDFQCRMASFQNCSIKVGQLYSALELSRVDAGVKSSVNVELFTKHNSFAA